jgi:hypothetical protein
MLSNLQIQKSFMERQKLFEYIYNKPLFTTSFYEQEEPAIKEVYADSDEEQVEEIKISEPKPTYLRKRDKKRIEEKKKLTLMLLNRAEAKFTLGKFKDCYNDCCYAEKICREIRTEPKILARAILGKGKSKFKLGDIKEAHVLIQESLQLHNSADAQSILKEVEKMAYFESLLDFSLNNPLYPQIQFGDDKKMQLSTFDFFNVNNLYHSSVRSPISVPKMIPQHKYTREESDSWQQKFVQYSKKIQLLSVKS